MVDEMRVQLVGLRGRVPVTKDRLVNKMADIEFLGALELVIKFVDDVQVDVPGLEGIAWLHVPQKPHMHIEFGKDASYSILLQEPKYAAEERALELYPIEDGGYPGVDRNAAARAAYLRGREEHGR